ncbi:hypothetical protein FALCPG4_018081 [Fusarium falciforme]
MTPLGETTHQRPHQIRSRLRTHPVVITSSHLAAATSLPNTFEDALQDFSDELSGALKTLAAFT